jgi:hypothetical protein
MGFVRTLVIRADPLGQLPGRERSSRLDHGTFAMNPFGFNGIEPGTLCGKAQRQNTDPFARLFDLLIVLSDPGSYDLADMPGRVIPNQQPGAFALCRKFFRAPVKKLGGDVADGAPCHKTKPHFMALGIVWQTLLPQDTIAGQRFGIRIALFPGLLLQMHWMLGALPGRETRESKARPPDLIEEADRPVRLLAGPGNQVVASVFFRRYGASGLVIQCLARFQLVFSCLRARRTLSSEIEAAMMPCSRQTWATSSSVQMPRFLPDSRGL